MSFLTPLFLLGGLAVALPVIFHLIRRTTREKTPFSSLMFLMPSPPQVTRRSRLENLWLLLLRCIVIGLLAFGFARPFFQRPPASASDMGETRKRVLLVDTSASMRRGEMWSLALAKAGDILAAAKPNDQFAIMTFDRQPRTLMTFEQWAQLPPSERAALAAQRLKALAPTWAGTHLGSALVAATEMLEQAHYGAREEESILASQIILVSDLQEGSRVETLQGYDWPRRLELQIETIPAPGANAGLQLALDDAAAPRASTNLPIRVRVSNSKEAKKERFQIHWDGAAGSPPLDVYAPPGQSRVVPVSRPASINASEKPSEKLILAGDNEPFDNEVSLVPPKPEEIDIVFLGNDSETDPAQLLYYLRRAFQETVRHKVRVHAWPASNPSPGQEEILAKAALVIASDTLTPGQLEAARKSAASRKTVLFALTSAGGTAALGSLLGIPDLAAEESPKDRYALLGSIDFQHPFFAPFADPRYSDFAKIQFWKHRRFDISQTPGAQVLARFDNGDPAFVEIPAGAGKVLLLTAGWHPADSQFALSSKFVPLLYSLLEAGGALGDHASHFQVGEPVEIPGAAPRWKVVKPDGVEVEGELGRPFTSTDLPGIYHAASISPPFRFAVNLAPEESRTSPLPIEELERLGAPLKAPVIQKTARMEENERHLLASELEGQQKLWRWLIAAAVVFAALETWLAGRLTHRPSPETVA